jgi:hypothetical protein
MTWLVIECQVHTYHTIPYRHVMSYGDGHAAMQCKYQMIDNLQLIVALLRDFAYGNHYMTTLITILSVYDVHGKWC